MDKTQFEILRAINTDRVAWELADSLRGLRSEYTISTFALAYVLYMASKNSSIDLKTLDSFIETSAIEKEKALFVADALSNCWASVIKLANQFDTDTLSAYILFNDTYVTKAEADYTPTGVSQVAVSLLGITNGDVVADFGTGRGSFIRDCYGVAPSASYYGNDINTSSKEIASLRAKLLGGNITIKQENIFDMDLESLSFDKVFSNYPFGLRIRDIGFERNAAVQVLLKRYPSITKSVSSDWLFNAILINSINKAGKAVGIMTNGSTWNSLDKEVRKYFLESGSIEAVIALPERLFENITIPTTMILLSHGNKNVMLVDAHNMCEKGRRINTITENYIHEILACYANESKYSKRLTFDEIASNDYILNPIRYMEDDVAIENGIPFDSIIRSITRGAQLTAEKLDKLVSKEPTNVQYLMLGNIQDGAIDENLPYLVSIDPKLQKYCLKNNSLILSKNGYPFKVAVASIKEGQTVLANGNLYVIEIDEEKANPYFIKAFLESDKGVAALRSICVGATILNIGVEQLKRVLVPSTPLEKQSEVASKYLAAMDEIALLKRKISKATNSLKHIFDLSEATKNA